MAKKSKQQGKLKSPKAKNAAEVPGQAALTFYAELAQLKRKMDEITEAAEGLSSRLEDAEIHINLLTRFITTICIEKIGMRIGVLKRLLKRIESEAVRDSQIHQLESLYNLPGPAVKKAQPPKQPPSKKDPWEDIS